MSRHLGACEKRADRLARAAEADPEAQRSFLHIEVRDIDWGQHWLHLEMPASATLDALDRYLRAIWLECCGHVSQFSVGSPWRGPRVGKSRPIGRAFDAGDELTYVYDFGSSSTLRIRRVDERRGAGATRRPAELMARNDPPDFRCMACDAPATWLCMACVYEDRSGMLCEAHGQEHTHDEYELMPVVNSPRMGVCGYTGPATAPY
jgi:hypothetical protein